MKHRLRPVIAVAAMTAALGFAGVAATEVASAAPPCKVNCHQPAPKPKPPADLPGDGCHFCTATPSTPPPPPPPAPK